MKPHIPGQRSKELSLVREVEGHGEYLMIDLETGNLLVNNGSLRTLTKQEAESLITGEGVSDYNRQFLGQVEVVRATNVIVTLHTQRTLELRMRAIEEREREESDT